MIGFTKTFDLWKLVTVVDADWVWNPFGGSTSAYSWVSHLGFFSIGWSRL